MGTKRVFVTGPGQQFAYFRSDFVVKYLFFEALWKEQLTTEKGNKKMKSEVPNLLSA